MAVAYSGGRDSTALLHATVHAARAMGLHVHALHVHHGLSPHADAWLRHCRRRCRAWAQAGLPVSLHHARLLLPAAGPAGLEATAREARYAALAQMAREQGCPLVLLAHHRDDQAETFLLQALRGAGPAGLAAMPVQARRGGVTWARPWLQQPRSAVEAYVRRYRLRYVDDDSNAEPRFARNRLRLQVWPALVHAFPAASHVLADAARAAQDAAQCLAELAAADLAAVSQGAGLRVEALAALGPARGRNVLRHWLGRCGDTPPPGALLHRLWHEAAAGAAPARWACDTGEVRRYRGVLHWAGQEAPVAHAPAAQDLAAAPAWCLHRLEPGRVEVPAPWGGWLAIEPALRDGLPATGVAPLELRPRQGGEQFQSRAGGVPRALKKQYQAAGVPAWERRGPLVYAGGRLVFVPGLGVDARVRAAAGTAQFTLRWLPPGADPGAG